jgi:hypothetical protein
MFLIILIIVLLIVVNTTTTTSSSAASSDIILLEHPDIFLIGAMKAGTTSFHNLVVDASHGLICGSGEKEKHFFNGGEYKNNYKDHVNNYNNEFKECKSNQMTRILLLVILSLKMYCLGLLKAIQRLILKRKRLYSF